MGIKEILELKHQYDTLSSEVIENTSNTLSSFYESIQKNLSELDKFKLSTLNGNNFKFNILEYEFTVSMLEGCAVHRKGKNIKGVEGLVSPSSIIEDERLKSLLSGSIVVFGGVRELYNIPQGRFFVNSKKQIAYESLSGWNTIPFFEEIDDVENHFFNVIQGIISNTVLGTETYWKPKEEIRDLKLTDIVTIGNNIGFK